MNLNFFRKPAYKFSHSILEWMLLAICLVCVFLFLFSAYEKLVDHERFAKGLSRAPYVGAIGKQIAWAVPLAEIGISVLLIIPQTCKQGLYAFAGLMGIFTGYIVSMLLLAEKLPCHCNLIVEKLSWSQHIWFNLGFIALASGGLWLHKKLKLFQNE